MEDTILKKNLHVLKRKAMCDLEHENIETDTRDHFKTLSWHSHVGTERRHCSRYPLILNTIRRDTWFLCAGKQR